MSLPRNSDSLSAILSRIKGVYRRMRFWFVVHAFARLAGFAGIIMYLCVSTGKTTGQPSQPLRYFFAFISAALLLWGLYHLFYRLLLWRQSPLRTARFIETQLGNLDNKLINPLLLASDDTQHQNSLVEVNIDQCARDTARADLFSAVKPIKKHAVRFGVGYGIVFLISLFICLRSGQAFSRGLAAIANPLAYVENINGLEVSSITPGDTTIFAGRDVNVKVVFRDTGNDDSLPTGKIVFPNTDQSVLLTPDSSGREFSTSIKQVYENFNYAVVFKDDRWPVDKPWFGVNVIKNIKADSITQHISFPKYTKLPDKTAPSDGTITAPLGSMVTTRIMLDRNLPAGRLVTKSGRDLPIKITDSNVVSFTLPVTGEDYYKILLLDENGKTIQEFPGQLGLSNLKLASNPAPDGWLAIKAIPDTPPLIKISSPAGDISAAPADKINIKIVAEDQYELNELKLFWKTPDGKTSAILTKPINSNLTTQTLTRTLPANLPTGNNPSIEYYAQVTDTCDIPALKLKPQTSKSRTLRIKIQNPQKILQQNILSYENIKSRLMEVLNLQITQRVNTSICVNLREVEKIRSTGNAIHKGQRNIEKRVADILAGTEFTGQLAAFKYELTQLHTNELVTAVTQAQVLTAINSSAPPVSTCRPLAHTQDSIIHSLRSMLAIMGEFADPKTLQDIPDQPAQREKLAQLSRKLEELQTDLARAIKDTSKLPHTPADDFSLQDEKLLADLKANMDKWEKFLEDTFSDFSKLRMQDFSNPQMLEELLSVKCDVTMAKDALAAKASEIATAMENNGLENAETLTANLEKWLPDVPDREKWAMEAPDTFEQENIEMADLPSQLEDLMGDLLEQEEDLFDQMQDVTSKATSSMDKGAGWDAVDGPISSMNAQGVTGNQLPNSSEIQGRSGEGRTGKATGEHVEDKAVGKGGRRTPTRLTPEPYQAGQVKDTSSEPPGGATGGGKVSGTGSQGLQGPPPPQLDQQLKRLATQQAELISKANKIRRSVKTNNLANMKMLKSIVLMNRVNDNLRSGNYLNAMRMRNHVLENLQDTSVLISGDIKIQTDATAAVPKHIRDDISTGTNQELPSDFENALRQYYKKIAR